MSNQSEVTGKIFKIFPEEQKSENFKTRLMVLELEERDPKYNQYVPFEFVKDKCELLDVFKEGEMATVTYNLRGREWQGKYYASLSAWKILKK